MQAEKSLFKKNTINEARKLLESVIVHTKDNNQSVSNEATLVAHKLKNMNIENFDLAFKRLS